MQLQVARHPNSSQLLCPGKLKALQCRINPLGLVKELAMLPD